MPDLDDLLVSGKALDRARVTSALKPYVRLDQDAKAIRPHEGWAAASAKAKVLATLLAQKAMVVLDVIPADQEPMTPVDIIKVTGVPRGTVAPTLKALYEARPQLVDKDKSARYTVPSWAVSEACSLLEGGAK